MNRSERATILGIKMTAVVAGLSGLASSWKPSVITVLDFELAAVTTAAVIVLTWLGCYKILL